MRANCFQKFTPVLNKKCWFTHRLQIFDQISGGYILYSCATRIKYFTHPNFISGPEHPSDLCNKIISQETGGSIPMWLEPGYHFWCDFLAGFNGHRTFYGVMRIIINQPDSVFFSQHLMTP